MHVLARIPCTCMHTFHAWVYTHFMHMYAWTHDRASPPLPRHATCRTHAQRLARTSTPRSNTQPHAMTRREFAPLSRQGKQRIPLETLSRQGEHPFRNFASHPHKGFLAAPPPPRARAAAHPPACPTAPHTTAMPPCPRNSCANSGAIAAAGCWSGSSARRKVLRASATLARVQGTRRQREHAWFGVRPGRETKLVQGALTLSLKVWTRK